jgi:sortase A
MWNFQKTREGQPGSESGTGQTSKHRWSAWKWVERLLLVAGLALLGFYGAARIESMVGVRVALKNFAAISSSMSGAGPDARAHGESPERDEWFEDASQGEVDFSLWDAWRVQAYKQSFATSRNSPLGVLRIPKIQLEVPLLEGTDDLTLNRGVGRIAGTARPGEQGNIGIAGHRDGFFRGLKDVSAGDAIELKTLNGTETYVIDRIQIVTPADVSVLQPRSVPSLTLVTCYPFYFIGSAPKRYIVTASLAQGDKGGPEISQPARYRNTRFNKEKK